MNMELSRQARCYLLRIINSNGNIEPLREIGYEYFQIASFINIEIEQGNVESVQGVSVLTSKGLDELKILSSKNLKSGSSQWIEPEIQSKILNSGKKVLFLPNQDDLWFD